jgi:hypothetical protein
VTSNAKNSWKAGGPQTKRFEVLMMLGTQALAVNLCLTAQGLKSTLHQALAGSNT